MQRRSRARSPQGPQAAITIPQELRQPVQGLDASLDGARPDVHGKARQELHRLEHRLQGQEAQGHRHARCSPARATAPGPARRCRSRQARRAARSSVADPAADAVPRRPRLGGAVVVLLDSSAVLVFAHGIVGRADLPIPEAVFGAAAAACWSSRSSRSRRCGRGRGCRTWPERRLFRAARSRSTWCSAPLGVARASPSPRTRASRARTRSATTSRRRWSTSRSGSACRSPRCSLGDVWRLLSPWRAIGRGAGWLAARRRRRRAARAAGLPGAAGPLAGGARACSASAICELCWGAAREPAPARRADARLRRRHARRDEPLRRRGVDAQRRRRSASTSVASPRSRRSTRRDGVLYARPPVVGAGRLDGAAGTAARAASPASASTAFDGASEGPLFNDAAARTCRSSSAASASGRRPRSSSASWSACSPSSRSSALIWTLGVAGMPRLDGRAPGPQLVHSLVPILAAYVVAHYFSLLAYNGQDLAAARLRPARRRQRPVRRRRTRRSTTASSRRRRSGTCRSARS